MNFWTAVIAFVVASGVVYVATSINGVTEPPAGGHGHGHGHDDHGHGHDDHGHGHGKGHGHH